MLSGEGTLFSGFVSNACAEFVSALYLMEGDLVGFFSHNKGSFSLFSSTVRSDSVVPVFLWEDTFLALT